MNNLKLEVSLQGVRGSKTRTALQGFAVLTTRKNGSETCQISVDVFQGAGDTYSQREDEEITIAFHDGKSPVWRGTSVQLKEMVLNSFK